MQKEIRYLGYIVSERGIKPDERNINAVVEFPIPQNAKAVHSFLGLCSYFRRFIKGFSVVAQPLMRLLRKNVKFEFNENELNCFEFLKRQLVEAPVLGIFNPSHETELHCDASSIGFGAILLQKGEDNNFHPIFYFSKSTTECESRYHSYELETLAILYALRRFRIYLQGLHFKIYTDCNSLALTLKKRDINQRIARWALEFENYDYTLVHREGSKMQHVDALSRISNILVLEGNSFEQELAINQSKDENISKIRKDLEKRESNVFEMRNGLVYRKNGDRLLFYVPMNMEKNIMRLYHDEMGHRGRDKVLEAIMQTYWFPKRSEKILIHIKNCLKCIVFTSKSNTKDKPLHSIPKGDIPFSTLHIDHLGPLKLKKAQKKYVFLIVDAFSKFVKLYATRSTDSKEAIVCLNNYFRTFSRPDNIISDRGSAFTSKEFEKFLEECNVQHIKIATGSPQANGQAERFNRCITPMIAINTNAGTEFSLDKVLPDIEFALNNTVNRSTGSAPSELLFGIRQKGLVIDYLKDELEHLNESRERKDLEVIRQNACEINKKMQENNEVRYNKNCKIKKYEVGDYVLVQNFESAPGICKKIIPKFKGPYRIKKVLPNDRYLLCDVENFQLTQIPYEGIWEVSKMKPYPDTHTEVIGTLTCQDGRTVVGS